MIEGESMAERKSRLSRARVNAWASRNKNYLADKSLKDRLKNPEKFKARNRSHYARNSESRNRKWREWYQKNKDQRARYAQKYMALNKEKLSILNKEWRSKNWRRVSACRSRRIAFERGAIIVGSKSADDLILKWKSFDEFSCFYCSKINPVKFMEIDHVIPVSKGGVHSVDNICRSCKRCNRSKKDKMISSFIVNGRGFLL